jgi:uncharacterized protein YggE
MKEDKHFHGTLDVSGIGRINVTPDEATVHLTTITEAESASEAVATNSEITQAVVDAVSALPNHGVTTSGLGVNPMLEYEVSRSRIVGYRATNNVTVKTKIGYAAQVFDAGITAGANESSGISFGLHDETQFREEALRQAIKSAFNEARIAAKAADIQIEGPESILIDSGGGRVVYMAKALERSAPSTPVIPDDMIITASVQIVFRTKSDLS